MTVCRSLRKCQLIRTSRNFWLDRVLIGDVYTALQSAIRRAKAARKTRHLRRGDEFNVRNGACSNELCHGGLLEL